MFGTKSNMVLTCARQTLKYILNLHRVQNLPNFSLEHCAFNICIAITFISIHFVIAHNISNRPVYMTLLYRLQTSLCSCTTILHTNAPLV